jgi:hypothetical protein
MNIDVKTIRPILQTKKNQKVTDPPRYPAIIEPIENQAKREYADILEMTLTEISKKMVNFKSKK